MKTARQKLKELRQSLPRRPSQELGSLGMPVILARVARLRYQRSYPRRKSIRKARKFALRLTHTNGILKLGRPVSHITAIFAQFVDSILLRSLAPSVTDLFTSTMS